MKRLHHPSILRILEASENPKALDFAAEPVMSCLAHETSFSPDDASYFAFQLATVLRFLHQNVRMVLFGLSTHSLCVTKTLALKVCVFNFAAPIVNDSGGAIPRMGDYVVGPFQPPLNFCSPEYVQNRQPTLQTDIFSFGCVYASVVLNRSAFDCGGIDEFARITAQPIVFPQYVSPAIAEVVRACLSHQPGQRPSPEEILDAPAFRTLAMQALQYVDIIVTKPQEDKFKFFRGVAGTLTAFSLRMLQSKMAPLFISEVILERKFATVLIPLIFEIARSFDRPTFYEEVMVPLADVLVATSPPQCLLAVVCSLPIIIDQVDDERQYELCYPIFAAALSTSASQIHREALKHMPKLVAKMTREVVETDVLPALIDLFSTSDDVSVVCACVKSLAECLPKLDHNSFSERVGPRITAAWNRLGEPGDLTDAVWSVVRSSTSAEVMMKEVIPMVSEVLASDASPPPTQLALCRYIKDSTTSLLQRKKPSCLSKPKAEGQPAAPPQPGRWQPPAELSAGEIFGNHPPLETPRRRWQAQVDLSPDNSANPPAETPPPPAAEPESPLPVPSMFAGMNTRPAKRAGSTMFSGMKMGGKVSGKSNP
jgi:hypothetical protein